ncbi:hypothetical protein ACPPVO_54060 [Dactylosporangium sp. McL0621]|uniref:hypothetical protein n=1 Tax=Dactylosporangium sp. McL0621 TaxID=3415678 RepID=UPI003CF43173
MRDLNATLTPAGRRQAAALAGVRYAALTVGMPPVRGLGHVDAHLRRFLEALAAEVLSLGDPAVVGELKRRVEGYLDAFDEYEEVPTGVGYYPYECVMQLLRATEVLSGRPLAARSFDNLWEYGERFAGHVDWELERSGVAHDLGQPFESAERDIWLAHVRLTGADDDAYYGVRGLGERFVRAAVDSLAAVYRA